MQSKVEASAARNLDKGTEPAPPDKDAVQPSWLRFLIPSVCDLVFVLLLLALTLGPLARGLLGDAGIGWHIRTGALILRTHSVPRVDPFSSTMYGKPWFAWEWLYDTAAGVVHSATGLNGVVFLSATIIALTFALTLRRILAKGGNLPIAVIVLLLAVAGSSIHFLARPHVLSWLLTVIWFGVLEDFEGDGRWPRLLWLPGLTLFWVNLHGGFLVGFVLLGICLVSNLLVAWASASAEEHTVPRSRARTLAITGVTSAAITLANPHGYKLLAHIVRYLSDRFLMDHIDEFLSPNFHGLPQKCFAVLVLLTVIAAGVARKKLPLRHLLVILFAIYAGLYAARNIPIASILLALIVAPQLSVIIKESGGNREFSVRLQRLGSRLDLLGARMAALEQRLRGHLWPALALLLGMWLCLHHGKLGAAPVMEARFDDKNFPVQAADFLEGTGSREPVFCPDRWGGYLIYRLYPQPKAAIDDRHDLYGAEFLKRYLKIVRGQPGWEQELAEMGVDWVLVPREAALASLLAEASRWKGVYRDETAVLFRRSHGAATSGRAELPP